MQRQFSRRVSVFSKSFDPDSIHEISENSLDNVFNSEEARANSAYETQVNSKSSEQSDKLRNVLLSIVLFKHLDIENVDSIVESMFARKCKNDELIIREGDEGEYFYVIMNGVFDVYKKKSSTNEDKNDDSNDYGVKVTHYKDKGYFGELALLYDQVIIFFRVNILIMSNYIKEYYFV